MALTTAQRRQRKLVFRRNKAKIKLGRERAKRRTATQETLKKRARKQARKNVEKKILKGRSKDDLAFAARQELEKRVDKKKAIIDRMAKKLLPKLRKKDREDKMAINKTTNEETDIMNEMQDTKNLQSNEI